MIYRLYLLRYLATQMCLYKMGKGWMRGVREGERGDRMGGGGGGGGERS